MEKKNDSFPSPFRPEPEDADIVPLKGMIDLFKWLIETEAMVLRQWLRMEKEFILYEVKYNASGDVNP